jgi:type II secretory pathway pseudopilin PulG
VDQIKCITSRLLRAARHEAGVTLIETLFAIVIFGIVSTALIGVLTSATAADSRSRQKTIALELAQQQIEYIRQLNYGNVGLVDGNPGGVVQAVQSKEVTGLWYTLTTSITYVDDPTPGSYVTAANFKRIQVVITRASDGAEVARARTYVSSATPLETGGLNNGLINVTVQDFQTKALLGSVRVHLAKTWDAGFSASDYTGIDSGLPSFGVATFKGLEPTPTDPDPLGYYDITATLVGYTTLAADLPPSDSSATQSAGHIALEKSGTSNTTIYLYKPSGIIVHVIDGSNAPSLYTGSTTVTISSVKLGVSQQFTTTDGTVTLNPGDTLDGDPIAPGSDYQVDVATTTPYERHGLLTGLTVPSNYPTNLSSTFDVPLPDYVPPVTTPVTVTVRNGSWSSNGCTSSPKGSLQSGATVKLIVSDTPSTTYSPSSFGGGTYSFTGIPVDTYDISAKYSPDRWHTYQGTLAGQVISTTSNSFCVSIS